MDHFVSYALCWCVLCCGVLWSLAGLLAVVFVVFCHFPKRVLVHTVKYFANRSKAVLLLWTFYVFFCLVFVMPLCASVYFQQGKG